MAFLKFYSVGMYAVWEKEEVILWTADTTLGLCP